MGWAVIELWACDFPQLPVHGLRLDHAIGRQEPMLWVADALCGIITSLRSGNTVHYNLISSQTTLMVVQPR